MNSPGGYPACHAAARNCRRCVLVNTHLNSKGGDGALFGDEQPPVLGSEAQRIRQAQVINDYVDGLLAATPDALVKVVGDLNDFTFSQPLKVLTGEATGTPVLHGLAATLLPANEQYTYVFEGNAQALDHHLDSDALLPVAPDVVIKLDLDGAMLRAEDFLFA